MLAPAGTALMMGTVLKFQCPQLILNQYNYRPRRYSSIITCGMRTGPRKPLWREKRLSNEAIQAVQSLKLAKSSVAKLEQVFNTKLSRLLKTDLLDTFEVLRSQDELDLALKVFEFVKKEVWYQPDITLYHAMLRMLGRNKLIEKAEEFFSQIEQEEGLNPDTRAFTELIGAYMSVDMIDKAMETYERMKASGCAPEKLTFVILIRQLEEAGRQDLADAVKEECADYLDYPQKFFQELERMKNIKRMVSNPV